jgi:hypothetical protein
MQSTNNKGKSFKQLWLSVTFGAACLPVLSGVLLAQQPNQETFPSAEKASNALFTAVQSNNEGTITQVLGGGNDLTSCGDSLDDQKDREVFAKKYQEMHRLVEEKDGTTVLYVGAENWPFPVPLISKNGKWYFDADAGSDEVRFRRIGENEENIIEICESLAAMGSARAATNTSNDDADIQYIQTLVDVSKADSDGAGTSQQSNPVHGYYFRSLEVKGGKGRSFVAYPAEYKSSGVLTFIVAPNGVVYEKDLGPQTTVAAKIMTTWKPNRSWHVVK